MTFHPTAMRRAAFALAFLFAPAAFAQTLTGLTSCCPNTVVTLDPETGETVPIAEVGTATDVFNALVGSAVIDVAGGRAFLVRNGVIATADLVTGEVTDGPDAFDFVQLAGYDTARDRLLAFATERLDAEGEPTRLTNYLVAYDPATQDTVRIARVGQAVIGGEPDDPYDAFASVSGPAVADGTTLFTIRNGVLVSVDLETGGVTESGETDGQLLGYDAPNDVLYRLARETVFGDTSRTDRRYIVRETGSTRDTLALVTTSTIAENGDFSGDVLLASLGTAVYDAAGDRVVLNRNGEFLSVDLATGALTEGASATAGVVGGALGRVAVSALPEPAPALALAAAPNPARGAVTVSLARGTARVEVFDVLGRRVAVLADGAVGDTLVWRTNAVPPGVYRIRAVADGRTESVSVTVAR